MSDTEVLEKRVYDRIRARLVESRNWEELFAPGLEMLSTSIATYWPIRHADSGDVREMHHQIRAWLAEYLVIPHGQETAIRWDQNGDDADIAELVRDD